MTIALLIALAAAPAHAECKTIYRGEELIDDLGKMTTALRALDETTFNASGARLADGLPCVGTQVPTPVFASAYRYIGAWRYVTGDQDGARRWFRSALELDATYEWDINDLEQDHPLRVAFNEERAGADAAPVAIEGMVLNLPAGSTLLLDGRPLKEPAATIDRPHLLQQVGTEDRAVRQTFLIEGNQIPERFLRPRIQAITAEQMAKEEKAAREAKNPKKKSREDAKKQIAYGDYEVVKIERVRPPAKTPLLVTGAVGVLASGGIYAASFATRTQFDRADTTDDLEKFRGLTNGLVVASGATLAGSIGLGWAGILLDGGAAPHPSGWGLGLGGSF